MTGIALVTGGSGFIGWWVVRALVQRSRRVRVLDPAAPPVHIGSVEHIPGSVTEAKTVRSAMDGVDEVYHLAATPNFWNSDPSIFERLNHQGARRVFEAAAEAGVGRVVHVSSATALADRPAGPTPSNGRPWLPEPARTAGPYSRSKVLAERAAQEAFARGVPVTVATVTTPIGPDDRNMTPPTQLLLDLLRGRIPALPQMRWLLSDVRDAAQGIVLASEHGRPGARYVLHGHAIMTDALLAALLRLSGRPMPKRRVPYWLALAAAEVGEAFSRLSRRRPQATVESVRLTRSDWDLSEELGPVDIGMTIRPLEESLADAIRWFEEMGWIAPSPETRAALAEPPVR